MLNFEFIVEIFIIHRKLIINKIKLWTKLKRLIKSFALLIYVKLHMTLSNKCRSETTSLLVLSLIRVRLRTSVLLRFHPRWELLNGVEVMECCIKKN